MTEPARAAMTRKQSRLVFVAIALAAVGLAVGVAMMALRDNIVFFYSPSEIAQKDVQAGARVRIGGLVKQGSVARSDDRAVAFEITDFVKDARVVYRGLLPDLFREGQGVVAEGRLDDRGVLQADSVLAKHDEKYMPREVADALKQKGVWQGEQKK